MGRRVAGLAAVPVLVGVLGGCVFSYDVTPPRVQYDNRLGEDVVVAVDGEDQPFEREVRSGTSGGLGTHECRGTAIVVQSTTGTEIGRVDEAACPGWTLLIGADGSLEYSEDEE
jgi:hypothetical protein